MNARWLRVAAGVLGVVILLWGNDVSLSRLFWSLVFVLAVLAGVHVLVGAGRGTGATRALPPTEAANSAPA